MKRTWPSVPVVLAGVEPFVGSGKTLLDNISNLLGWEETPCESIRRLTAQQVALRE